MEIGRYYPTGNEFISLPTIREDGAIESINFLHMGYRGLIEICGDPLFRPVIAVNGIEKEMEQVKSSRINYWVPSFTGKVDNLEVEMTVFAPLGQRGFVYKFKMKNNDDKKEVRIGLDGKWTNVLHSINESKVVDGKKNVYHSLWNKGPMFDYRNGVTLFSFGFVSHEELDSTSWESGNKKNETMLLHAEEEISYFIGKNIVLDKGEEKEFFLYLGVGLEEVGAAASAIEMERQGGSYLLEELNQWLAGKVKYIEDEKINEIFNLNLFFNYFYAAGRTIDTEDIVLVTSRSPRYYVSAAYWDRDSLLWSFPALLITDQDFTYDVLKYVFTKQIRNVGVHSRYIDGTVLEPGFELDEACAPIIALDKYIQFTKDYSILKKDFIREGLDKILKLIKSKKHKEINLYETFLQPTDDMRVYPYLTYNNVLVWKSFNIVSEFLYYLGDAETSEMYKNMAQSVKDDIYKHCVIKKNNRDIFAWAVDMNGNCSVYDEPPGSLTLLSYLGFTKDQDEIFRNTYDYIYSEEFTHYFKGTVYEELGCTHADHPWILSVSNSLVSGRKEEALDILRRTPLDNGIACESIDEYTGLCTTGAHFATCAGFLCFTLYEACINSKRGK